MTIFQFLTACDDLKRILRTGWLLLGIPPSQAENVAGHSHTTAIIAYILAKESTRQIDYERLLLMALLHDLPEAKLGDIPRSAYATDPQFEQAKLRAEDQVMKELLTELPNDYRNHLQQIWQEYNDGQSWEARIVEAADRVATVLHAAQLVKVGHSAELFSTFLNQDKKSIKTSGIAAANELIAEIEKIMR